MGDSAAQIPGIGWESVTLSLASLGVVCLVAWGTLRLLAGRGIGKASGAIRVVARCPLEPRRSVFVIETAGRCFLVGVGDGPMALLAELDADKLPRAPESAALRFGDVLARVLGRSGAAAKNPPADAPVKPISREEPASSARRASSREGMGTL
jgi:flagellar biosynthetic protein FliO